MDVIRYAKLPVTYNAEAIQSELQSSQNGWKPHFNTYDYTGSWNVLPLRAPGGNHANIFADLMTNEGYNDTIYMEQFPTVKKIIAGLHCPIMAVRFLNLQACAVIKQHKDSELAFEKGEARLHFPIFTNPGVEFYCESERVFLQKGECWYLNANLPHRVTNNGDTDRIHLVIDCGVNSWLKELMSSATQVARKYIDEKPGMLNTIAMLRLQNTEAANNLANKLEEELELLRAQNS
jgi:hypothetical protein